MFIGYTREHTGDYYRMWNPNTGRVNETYGIIFLHLMFYQNKCEENSKSHPTIIIEVSRDGIVKAISSEIEEEEEISLKVELESRESGSK